MRLFLIFIFFLLTVNIYSNINDDFILALNEKKYVKVRELLNDGADINKKNNDEISPLTAMVIDGNQDMVQLLLTYGANVSMIDNEGFTALHHAVELERFAIAEILISGGAETNSISNNNETPVFLALENKDIKMVELLIKKGGEIDIIPPIDPILEDYLKMRVSIRNRLYGLDYLVRTELMEAVFLEDFRLSETLISEGADLNEQNEMGLTALMIAAGKGNSYLTRLLLNKGASVSLSDEQGLRALSYSMLNSNRLIVDELLEKQEQIDPNALFYALIEGKKEYFALLAEKAETLNIFDKNNRSLLMYASYIGDYFAVRRILEKDGKVNLTDYNNMSALNYCLLGMKEAGEDYYRIASALVEKGAYSQGLTHRDPEMTLALKGFR